MNNLSVNNNLQNTLSALTFTSLGHFMNDGFAFIFPVIADILSKIENYSPLSLTAMFAAFYTSSTLFGLFASRTADRGNKFGNIHMGIFLISIGITGFSITLIYSSLPYIAALLIGIGLRGTTAKKERSGKKASVNDVVNLSIILLTAVFFVKSVASQGMVAWIPTFLTYTKGVQIGATLGIVITIMYSSAIIGQPLFGVLVDRVDKRLLLFISSIGTALAMFGYMHTSGVTELVLLSLFRLFTFSGSPLTMSFVSEYGPKAAS